MTTVLPATRSAPARGSCATTRPFFWGSFVAITVLLALNPALFRMLCASLRRLPTTFGITTRFGAGEAVGAGVVGLEGVGDVGAGDVGVGATGEGLVGAGDVGAGAGRFTTTRKSLIVTSLPWGTALPGPGRLGGHAVVIGPVLRVDLWAIVRMQRDGA